MLPQAASAALLQWIVVVMLASTAFWAHTEDELSGLMAFMLWHGG